MMLADLLTVDTVIADLKALDKEGAIREMVATLEAAKLIKDAQKVVKALLDREKLGSTAIGENVAIPHAKYEDIDDLVAVFGKSSAGVDFDSLDHKKVFYFFLLVAPKGASERHLKVLARISRLFRDANLRKNLEKAASPEDILNAITDTERSF